MTDIGFHFPVNEAGQWNGFNDPGLQYFTGNPFTHLAREVPQNSVDAKVEFPVTLKIALISVPIDSICDVETLREVVSTCASSVANSDDEKAIKFFDKAKQLISGNTLHVLQISDSNTRGVEGPCENGKPFFALLKATGQSSKDAYSTGSYGIGKNAPFTISALRTVIVSTAWKAASGDMHYYVQGKSILMSFKDQDNKTRSGTGFWGLREGCLPIEEVEILPEWLRRGSDDTSARGTTLNVLGFIPTHKWQKLLLAKIAENFFGAIYNGELVVEIEGTPTLDRDTLPDILSSNEYREVVANEPDEPDLFDDAGSYVRVLMDTDEVIKESTENQYLGECELRILIGENLPKKVAILRNGMLVTDELPKLKKFPDFKEFAAVLECRSTKGLKLLRGMEPPAHDAFEPARLPADQQKIGSKALTEIAKWARDMLKRHAQDVSKETTALDELAEYFSEEADESSATAAEEHIGGRIIIRAKPVKAKTGGAVGGISNIDNEFETGDGSAVDGEGEGHGAGEGGTNNAADNLGDDGNSQGQAEGGAVGSKPSFLTGEQLKDVRAVIISNNRRRIAFTPAKTGRFVIELQESGADSNYSLPVLQSTTGEVVNGLITNVECVAGQRISFEAEFAFPFEGTVRVVANAI